MKSHAAHIDQLGSKLPNKAKGLNQGIDQIGTMQKMLTKGLIASGIFRGMKRP